jgi:uncharacterized membrane protein YfcA
MNHVILAVAGFLSGLTASMGLGGGFVLLVYLTLFTSLPQKEAQLINLVFFLPIALLSVFLHLKHHLIEKDVLKKAILWGLIGVIAGVLLSVWIKEELLSKLFGALVLLVGMRELFHKKKKQNSRNQT